MELEIACEYFGGCAACGYSEAEIAGWEREAEGHERSCELVTNGGWGVCDCVMHEVWAAERGQRVRA